MSQWTHVSGVLRVDGMPELGIVPDLVMILGWPSSNPFDDNNDDEPWRDAVLIPSGSEGSIQYAISDAGNGAVWKTVAIWGDLRDFGADDCAEIDAWFERIANAARDIRASKLLLRSAFLVVEVEYGPRYLLEFDCGTAAVVRTALTAAVDA